MAIVGYVASILIGISLGLIGGGGSILTVPVLVYLFGVEPVLASAYSLFIVGASSLVGAWPKFKQGFGNIKTAIIFGIPSIAAVYATRKFLVPAIPAELGTIAGVVVTKSLLMMMLFAVLMIAASFSMIRSKKANDSNEPAKQEFNFLLILLEGAFVGILTGLVGAGGGFLIIPALVLLSKLPMKQAVGTSLLIIAAKSLIGFTGDLSNHILINWTLLLTVTTLAIVGIFIGDRLSKKIDGNKLKKGFGWFVLVMGVYIIAQQLLFPIPTNKKVAVTDSNWIAPSIYTDNTVHGEERKLIIYGQDLIAHTAKYLGPKGSVAQITNGMNCQNCHLQAGAKAWGNNYAAVFANYPKFRDRSGEVESIYKRVSDCMERSLNGTAIDSNSKEFKAIYAYIKWLGQDVQKGQKPNGVGIEKLAYLNRAADPAKGQVVYTTNCMRGHGGAGQGQLAPNNVEYVYPPLWGPHSYNDGAGLYRISNFAGYVKNNMPFDLASHKNPFLTEEQCWDVAAYVNSQPRPHKNQNSDWPVVKNKPIDFPFAPYADDFSETQHKYGPFAPIQEGNKK